MFDDVVFYVDLAFSKPPFIVKGKHPLLGDGYEIKLTPEWTINNKDGSAKVDGQKFTGLTPGIVGIVGKVTFPDGSSMLTPEVDIHVKHMIPSEIFLAPRPKAAA